MWTIEQAVKHYETLASRLEDICMKPASEYPKQTAAWLRELKERRELPEIIFCRDCAKHNKDTCPLVLYRGKAQGHEFDYQFCVCAERRSDD